MYRASTQWVRAMALSLILIFVSIYFSFSFAEPSAEPQIEALIPEFWNMPEYSSTNDLYNFIDWSKNYDGSESVFGHEMLDQQDALAAGSLLSETIEGSAQLSPELSSHADLPLYKYVFVTDNPTENSNGTGQVMCRYTDGSLGLVEVPMEPVSKPDFLNYSAQNVITSVGDVMVDGEPHTQLMITTTVVADSWPMLYKNNGALDMVYYSFQDIENAEVTVKHAESGIIAQSAAGTYTAASATVINYLLVPKPVADSLGDAQNIESSLNFEYSIKAADGSVLKVTGAPHFIVQEPLLNPVKPPFIDIDLPRECLETMPIPVSDRTISASRRVFIDGAELTPEEVSAFFGGRYFLPLACEDKVHSIDIEYTSESGLTAVYRDHIMSYTLKPLAYVRLSGDSRQNRFTTASSEIILSDYARNYATVSSEISASYSFEESMRPFISSELLNLFESGAIDPLLFRQNSGDIVEFLPLIPGHIAFDIEAQSHVDPSYIQRELPPDYFEARTLDGDMLAIPDLPPALMLLPGSPVYIRTDGVKIYWSAVSLDDDSLASKELRLFKLKGTGAGVGSGAGTGTGAGAGANAAIESEVSYVEGRSLPLGRYRAVLKASERLPLEVESFIRSQVSDSQTLAALLAAIEADLTKEVSAEFMVDNVAPATAMSIETTVQMPEADIVILTDNLSDSALIAESRVSIMDFLRSNGIDANVNHYDAASYSFTESVYTSVRTGEEYPPESYFYDRNGYKGYIQRQSVTNMPSYEDWGEYKEVSGSHVIHQTEVNTSGEPALFVWRNGKWDMDVPWVGGVLLPDSMTYNCDEHGVSVTAYKDSSASVYTGGDAMEPTEPGSYEGEEVWIPFEFTTIYKGTCTYSTSVWEPFYVTIDDYTGHYSGDVTKTIVKEYRGVYRHLSEKVTCLFNSPGMPSVSRHFLSNIAITSDQPDFSVTGRVDDLKSALLNKLREELLPKNIVVINTPITINTKDTDLEGDPTQNVKVIIEHNPNFFENPGKNMSGTTALLPSTLKSAGKYRITRVIEDIPTEDGVQKREFSKQVGATIEVLAHRRPVADFEIDWDFEDGMYSIKIDDRSYDPDFQSAPDRGLSRKVFRYRALSGPGSELGWRYTMPRMLAPGSYELSLTVKDRYGAWSDECKRSLELSEMPEVLINARLEGVKYDVTAIPAGEEAIVKDIKTKYYRSHDLNIEALGSTDFQSFRTARSLGNKNYGWRDFRFRIPETTRDGRYTVKLRSGAGSLELPLNVFTPIEVTGSVAVTDRIELEATTNEYAKEVVVTLFDGTRYQAKTSLRFVGKDASGNKRWKGFSDAEAPDGYYKTTFTARTAAGKTASYSRTDLFEFLKIVELSLNGSYDIWDSDRYMSYEKIEIKVVLSRKAEKVELRFSPELEAMRYTNSNGVTYSYKEEFGHEVKFPIRATSKDGITWKATYILPIAAETIDWDDKRIRPPYEVMAKAIKGKKTAEKTEELDITGNVQDILYVRPIRGE